jgi:hypothetical protein
MLLSEKFPGERRAGVWESHAGAGPHTVGPLLPRRIGY